jgi:hypothetical protein
LVVALTFAVGSLVWLPVKTTENKTLTFAVGSLVWLRADADLLRGAECIVWTVVVAGALLHGQALARVRGGYHGTYRAECNIKF